jgi:hypothetical protein
MSPPRASDGDQRSPTITRISMSIRKNIPKGCSGTLEPVLKADTAANAPPRNSRPAAARTVRSLMTGTPYPSRHSPIVGRSCARLALS